MQGAERKFGEVKASVWGAYLIKGTALVWSSAHEIDVAVSDGFAVLMSINRDYAHR